MKDIENLDVLAGMLKDAREYMVKAQDNWRHPGEQVAAQRHEDHAFRLIRAVRLELSSILAANLQPLE